jgi:hypothetical protein
MNGSGFFAKRYSLQQQGGCVMRVRLAFAVLVFIVLFSVCSNTANAQWQTTGVPVCTFSRPQSYSTIVTDENGDAIITWTDVRNATIYWVYSAKLDVDGYCQFGCVTGTCIYCNLHCNWGPPVLDGAGGAIYPYSYYSSWPGDGVAKRKNGSGITQWEADISTSAGSQGYVCAVADGAGGAICIWEDTRGVDIDIYSQRVDHDGNVLWSAGGDTVVMHTGHQRLVTAVSDNEGGAVVIWRDYRNGNADIFAQRIDADGDILWDTGGEAICTDPSDQMGIVASTDGGRGAVIVWHDDRNGDLDIFGQRIDSNAYLHWVIDGTGVCTAAGDQELASIHTWTIYAFIAWTDERNGNGDIYAQRYNMDGIRLWAYNGRPICTDINDQRGPEVTTDEASGAIISWTDYRFPSRSVHAQRVNSVGDALWEEDGVFVVYGWDADIAPDRDHGAILSYTKEGLDAWDDIYAQRLFSDGTIIAAHADSTYPAQNELNIPTNTNIYVTFDMEMETSTLNDTTVIVTGRSTGLHAGTFSYDYMTETMIFNPNVDFSNGELVTVVLTSDIESSTNVALKPFVWSFTVEADGGGRTFPTRTDYTTGDYPLAVFAADLDDDGDLDVVTSNISDSIYVFPNNGNGTLAAFTSYRAGVDPQGLCAVDIDLDDDLDLVTANVNSHDIALFMNNGSGTFVPAVYRSAGGSGPLSIAPADVDGDGYVDLVVANRYSDDISVFLNVRGTLWYDSSVEYPVAEHPYEITAADFDNDGDLDVAVACIDADSVSVLLNRGDGTLDPHVPYVVGNRPNSITANDLDGDGDVDLAAGEYGDVDVAILLNNGDGTFAPYTSYAEYDSPRSLCTGDFDDDDDLDLAVGINPNPGYVSIQANEGDGSFWNYDGQRPVGGYPNDIFAADLDGDGDVDLAVNDQAGDHVTILLNEVVTDVPGSDELPKASALFQNHPNPFNPTTEIRYSLHRDVHVKLTVYNILGQHVITLVDEHQQAGYKTVDWNARNQAGGQVASGVYFYKLQAGDFIDTKKMILLR